MDAARKHSIARRISIFPRLRKVIIYLKRLARLLASPHVAERGRLPATHQAESAIGVDCR
jgi:hypothetical protein